MKLYIAPGACSQAPHIALNEAGLKVDLVKVDIPTHKTEAGDDFYAVNSKGYVPALVFDDGQLLTENVAILDWIAQQAPALVPSGALGRTRMIEAIGFMTEEVHKPFIQFMFYPGDEVRAINREAIAIRFAYLADSMKGPHLFGDGFSAADAMLFVMTAWGFQFGIEPPARLKAFHARVAARPAVQAALEAEGLA